MLPSMILTGQKPPHNLDIWPAHHTSILTFVSWDRDMSDEVILEKQELPPEVLAEIQDIAYQYKSADTLLIKLINFGGEKAVGGTKWLSDEFLAKVSDLVKSGLLTAYGTANWTRSAPEGSRLETILNRVSGEKAHQAAATLSGAFGGVAGLASATAEIPVTVALVLRSIQNIAAEYQEDVTSEEVRLECIKVFGSGGPLESDDNIDVGYISARVAISGQAVQNVIQYVAPRFAAVLSNKLAAQAVPILGAVTGAGVNWSFMQYYQKMAHVRFRLRKLARDHSADMIATAFKASVDEKR